ncbi:FAD-binding domain-containing protein [Colletotrichum salicis]|uniref:FAD-binding domain-containing protein n=1 Tax=Colletotrichum salicis TaxID=1209931 RepID=A0A135TBK1_9PEZI|nr:FAD-binding domain-containing protein [Colletotrichum salicis]
MTTSTSQDKYTFYSGLAAFVLLSISILLPLSLMSLSRRLVRAVHHALVLLSLSMLCWHISLTLATGKILVGVFIGLWTASIVYPRLWAWLYGKGNIHDVVHLGDASIVQVRTTKPMKFYPGCYYYLTPSVSSLAVGPPSVVYHWNNIASGSKTAKTPPMVGVSELFLLIQDSQVLTKGLTQVLLDGPYGKHTHPEKYETVVLVAQGRGIAGVLPAALHVAQIGRHDRITRRIDLQWKLDHHDEEGWIEERLQNLIELDPHRSMDRIRKNIDQKSQYAGHMTVLACGDPDFTSETQSFVYRLPTLAQFTHIDFQSGNSHKVSPRDIRHIAGNAV